MEEWDGEVWKVAGAECTGALGGYADGVAGVGLGDVVSLDGEESGWDRREIL